MLGKEKAKQILLEALSYSTADEAEVYITGGKSWLTRFANNYIHQNVVQKDYSITARLIKGKKVGIASCNVFHDKYLKDVIIRAEEVLKNQVDDPNVMPVSSPCEVPELHDAYDEKTINFTPEESAREVEKVVEKSKKHNLTSAGTLSFGDNIVTFLNSKGNFLYHTNTAADFTLTAIGEEGGTGWSDYHCGRIEDLEIDKLTDIAIEKARLNKNPIELPPGNYPVILEEGAVGNFIMFLSYLGFGALSYQEGRSFMTGKMGTKIAGDNITIIDDTYRIESMGLPFDFEGVPRQKITLVENGIAKNVVYDTKTAKREGVVSTGHALPPPNTSGPMPFNLVLMPGKFSKEEIIANTDKAILITRFWYDNVVDPKKTIVTGLSRDGTFLVENGKITRAVRNMRYNNSVLDALSNVSMISNKLKTIDKYGASLACPVLKIEKFNFTGVSA